MIKRNTCQPRVHGSQVGRKYERRKRMVLVELDEKRRGRIRRNLEKGSIVSLGLFKWLTKSGSVVEKDW